MVCVKHKPVQYTVCITQCVLHSVYYTVCITQCVLHSVYYTVCITQCVLHSVYYTVCITQCVLHSVYYTVCITQCVYYTYLCVMYYTGLGNTHSVLHRFCVLHKPSILARLYVSNNPLRRLLRSVSDVAYESYGPTALLHISR